MPYDVFGNFSHDPGPQFTQNQPPIQPVTSSEGGGMNCCTALSIILFCCALNTSITLDTPIWFEIFLWICVVLTLLGAISGYIEEANDVDFEEIVGRNINEALSELNTYFRVTLPERFNEMREARTTRRESRATERSAARPGLFSVANPPATIAGRLERGESGSELQAVAKARPRPNPK
jgi:hypothetical protein